MKALRSILGASKAALNFFKLSLNDNHVFHGASKITIPSISSTSESQGNSIMVNSRNFQDMKFRENSYLQRCLNNSMKFKDDTLKSFNNSNEYTRLLTRENERMIELFQPLKCLLSSEPVLIDNIVFRLHSRVTVLILVTCSILISAKQYVGEPISCITDASIDKEPVNAYCWIYSTFTVSKHLKGVPGRSVASPGVGQALKDDEIHYHRYYQWVCFVLGLQAIIFYTPRALWGIWERGTVALLARDLASPFLRDVWSQERKEQLVEYFASTHLHSHNFYALCYLFCEALNFFNVITQIFLLDKFFEGQFRNYGPAVAAFGIETKPFERIDPMSKLFPKVTKCTIYTFGSSGSQQTHDALCILPLNVVNEKTFVFLWFWLIFLAIIGGINLIYRLLLFTQYKIRIFILAANTRILTDTQVEVVVRELNFGDWFVLHQLTQNVSPIVYRELVSELATKFSYKYYPSLV